MYSMLSNREVNALEMHQWMANIYAKWKYWKKWVSFSFTIGRNIARNSLADVTHFVVVKNPLISCYLDQWYGTINRNQLWVQMYPKYAWITEMDDMDFVHYQSFNPIIWDNISLQSIKNRLATPLKKVPIISCTKITCKSFIANSPTFRKLDSALNCEV